MHTRLWLAAVLALLGACGGSGKKTKQTPQAATTCIASADCSVSKQTLEQRAMMRMEEEAKRRGERRDATRSANDRRDEQQ